MTITSTKAKETHLGNDTNDVWTFPFIIHHEDEVALIHTDTDGVDTPITENFMVNGIGSENGGTVIYPADSHSPKLPVGEKITIRRVVKMTQDLDLQNQGGFYPDVVERHLDRLVMMIQQLSEDVSRSAKFSITKTEADTEVLIDKLTAAADKAADALAEMADDILPEFTPGVEGSHVRVKDDLSGYEFRTPTEMLADMDPDGNIVKKPEKLDVGFAVTVGQATINDGVTPNTCTPDPKQGQLQKLDVDRDFRLLPLSDEGVIDLLVRNDNVGAHAIDVESYRKIYGEYDDGADARQIFRLTRFDGDTSILEIIPMEEA